MKGNTSWSNYSDVGAFTSSADEDNQLYDEHKPIHRNASADFNQSHFLTNKFHYSVPIHKTSDPEIDLKQDAISQIITIPKNDPQLIYQNNDKSTKSKPSATRRMSNWYQYLAPSYRQKAHQFKRAFIGSSVDTDRLLVDYSCALFSNGLLTQGRMYITEEWICFYAKIINESKIMISVREIVSITKQKTAKVIPNAIQITHGPNKDRYFFTSFAAREKTFAILNKVWENYLNQQSMTIDEIVLQIREIYGDDSVSAMIASQENVSEAQSKSQLEAKEKTPDETQQPVAIDNTNNKSSSSFKNSSLSFLISPISNSNGVNIGNGYVKKESSISRTRNTVENLQLSTSKEDLSESFNSKSFSKIDLSTNGVNLTDSMDDIINESDTTDTDFDKHKNVKKHPTNDAHKFPNPNQAYPGPSNCGNTHDHIGREYANCEIPLNIDAAFKTIFTCCSITEQFCAIRGTTDYHVDDNWINFPWDPIENGKEILRKIHYTVALKQKLGPRSCLTLETQKLLTSESIPHRRYIVDTSVYNENVPLCTCFHVECRYCFLAINKHTTQLKVHAQVIFDKQVFFGAKNIIESTVRTNVGEHFNDLTELLCQQAKKLAKSDQITGGSLINIVDLRNSQDDGQICLDNGNKNVNDKQDKLDSMKSNNKNVSRLYKERDSCLTQSSQDSTWPGYIFSFFSCLIFTSNKSSQRLTLEWIILITISIILITYLNTLYNRFIEFEALVIDWNDALTKISTNGDCKFDRESFPNHRSHDYEREKIKGIEDKLDILETSLAKIIGAIRDIRTTVSGIKKQKNTV